MPQVCHEHKQTCFLWTENRKKKKFKFETYCHIDKINIGLVRAWYEFSKCICCSQENGEFHINDDMMFAPQSGNDLAHKSLQNGLPSSNHRKTISGFLASSCTKCFCTAWFYSWKNQNHAYLKTWLTAQGTCRALLYCFCRNMQTILQGMCKSSQYGVKDFADLGMYSFTELRLKINNNVALCILYLTATGVESRLKYKYLIYRLVSWSPAM